MKTLMLSLRYTILCSILISRVFAALNSSSSAVDEVPKCHPDDSSALRRFKSSFSETPVESSRCGDLTRTDMATWRASKNCCDWDGITCDAETGHVVSLYLFCVRLQGALTSNSALFSLAHLKKLTLIANDFRGSPILPEFGRFKKLTQLDFLRSNFNGVVPMEIAHLTKLVSFSISTNGEEQVSLGATTFESLSQNATHLKELLLVEVNMSTVSLASFSNLSSSLTSLTLNRNGLNGEIPETAFHFPKLQTLYLKGNNLQGIFPWSSINLESLSDLDLSNNNFTGQLPQLYSNFSRNTSSKYPRILSSSLFNFYLNSNLFSGKIPSWIYELPSLKFLSLDKNLFTGELEEFRTTSLIILSVGQNNLHGQIPKSIFHKLSKLESLDLSWNQFTGRHLEIEKLSQIIVLDLSSNKFTGNLEIEKLLDLKELAFFDISWTNLSLSFNNSMKYTLENLQLLGLKSCNIREFPNFLKSSTKLSFLDLSINQMQGSLPKWFEELGKDSFNYLNISHNFLTSKSIDPSHWQNLQYFDIGSNLFSGSLPIPNSSILSFFLAANNQFSGPIPTSICEFKSLELLDLSNNNFSGDIPQCMGNFSEFLSAFDLQNNKLRGVIPANFSRAISLRSLNLNDNQLEGPFPLSLAYCEGLEVVDLGNNLLEDTFPNWLEALPELRVLVLRGNRFHGPVGTPKISNPFPELRIIDLSDNDFNGSLPIKYLENFKAMAKEENVKMEYMGVPQYRDSVVVTIKGNLIKMVKIQTIFTTIDLSNNNFTGDIPGFLGRLKSLKSLNLSHNMIGGSIPSSLGNLSNLEGLDLSCNELVGKIPDQLVDIKWLSFLNLSYNHLQGSIPHGRQFNTFNNNSYEGNLALCGFPMSKSCDNNKKYNDMGQHDQGGDGETQNGITLDWKVIMMGYASGVVIGISIRYMVLFTRAFDRWSMKRFGAQSRRRSIHSTRGRRRRN